MSEAGDIFSDRSQSGKLFNEIGAGKVVKVLKVAPIIGELATVGEIVGDVNAAKEGDKVTSTAAAVGSEVAAHGVFKGVTFVCSPLEPWAPVVGGAAAGLTYLSYEFGGGSAWVKDSVFNMLTPDNSSKPDIMRFRSDYTSSSDNSTPDFRYNDPRW